MALVFEVRGLDRRDVVDSRSEVLSRFDWVLGFIYYVGHPGHHVLPKAGLYSRDEPKILPMISYTLLKPTG